MGELSERGHERRDEAAMKAANPAIKAFLALPFESLMTDSNQFHHLVSWCAAAIHSLGRDGVGERSERW